MMEILFRLLLLGYPREFRRRYGGAMVEWFRVHRNRARKDPRPLSRLRFWAFILADWWRNAPAERLGGRRRLAEAGPRRRARGRSPHSRHPRLHPGETMEALLRELRQATRRLARAPVFSLTAVAIIALAIGGNSAIFTFVNAMLLRPQPFAEPERLVNIYQDSDDGEPTSVSFPAYRDIAAHDDLFAGVTAVLSWSTTLLTEAGAEPLAVEYVTSNYFDVLGLSPMVGRGLRPEDELVGAEPVAVISEPTWRSRFGADPDIVGSTIRLQGRNVTVVGVGPAGYGGLVPGLRRDLFLSLSSLGPLIGPFAERTLERRSDHWFQVKARLAPGVGLEQVRGAMEALEQRLAREFPEYNEGREITVFGPGEVRMHPSADGQILPVSAGLMGVVGLVLLIACANLSNLMLARGAARAHDVSVRRALGASRARVMASMLSESLLLALAGAALGLLLAGWAVRLFAAADLQMPLPADPDLRIDARVVAFTALLSLGAAVLFGLLPAIRISRSDVVASLRDDVDALSVRWRRIGMRSLLVVTQVALSLVVLVTAGLYTRNLVNARQVDPGFDVDRIAALHTDLAHAGYGASEAGAVFEQLEQRIASLAGVTSVSRSLSLPVRGGGGSSTLVIEGYAPSTGTSSVEVARSVVDVGYFETLGIPVLHGRAFDAADGPEGPAITIVSEAMARAYWGRSDVVGENVYPQGSPDSPIRIVGVVADSKVEDLTEAPRPHFYVPLSRGGTTSAYVLARTAGNPADLLPALRAQLRAVDPALTVLSLQTLEGHIDDRLSMPRLGVALLSGFGLLGLALAAIGLYGVVAFAVARRSREVGIRVALGARGGDVVRLVLVEVAGVVAVGLVVGLGLAALVVPSVAATLYRVSPLDPAALLGSTAVLATAGLLAAWIPARRAARVDPVDALRNE